MRYALIVLAVAVAAVAAVTAGARQEPSAFEVVSVKENTSGDLAIRPEPTPPDGYRRDVPLASHLSYAFDITQSSRIVNLPEWTLATRYQIAGKAAGPITEPQRRAMLRQVLTSRFALRTHTETRELPVYVMMLNRPDKRLGPGLTPRPDCATDPCARNGSGSPEGVSMRATTLARFADGMLSNLLRQLVVDDTGVEGLFDVEASWRPAAGDPGTADTRPDMFTAFREQLGLKLEPARRPVGVLVIDHIERPTEN